MPDELTEEDIRKAVEVLRGSSLKPYYTCPDHQPDLFRIEGTEWIRFSCPNCTAGGAFHESCYDDLMKEEP